MAPLKFGDSVIEAVVFDLDGTLIHTTVDFRKMRQRLSEDLIRQGIPRSLWGPQDTIVSNLDRAVKYLAAHERGIEEERLRNQVGRLMDLTEMEKVSETRPVERAGECIDFLTERGLMIGLLTRGSRAYALAALHYAGLEQGFDAMVCRDDHPEVEAKPNGKAMERVADLLGISPEKCLMVGDHSMDMTCARSTSAQFIGVLTGLFSQKDWLEHDCPTIISSVADLPMLLGIEKE